MTENERKWIADCEKCNSSLKMPILGIIKTPLCQICKHSDFHYGTWDAPECSEYGEIPKDLLYCRNYDCPRFLHDAENLNNEFFDENHKPKQYE